MTHIELKKADYSAAKVGDIVQVTRYFSGNSDVKCTFKALIYGYVPKGRGHGKFKVKLLEMISPKTIVVSNVTKLK